MSIFDNYNYNTTPTPIDREEYTDVGSSSFKLGYAARVFGTGTDFEIWTAASGGTQLEEGTDYELLTKNNLASSRIGFDVMTRVRILNANYQTGSIFITYKIYQSETDADYFNYLNTIDASLQSQISALGSPLTVVKTADYTVLDDDTVTRIEVDTTSADVTITLPLIANNEGRNIEIAHIKGGTNKVIIVPNATDATKITNDDLAVLWLPDVNDRITLQHSTSSGFWESITEKISCHLRLNTHAGYGSTDTAIPRFTNLESIQGNLFTENHVSGYASNAEGLKITIQRTGTYTVNFSRHTGATYMGITLDSAELTTSIVSITDITTRMSMFGLTGGAGNTSLTRKFLKGQVIRPHTDKGGAAGTRTKFELTYLGN